MKERPILFSGEMVRAILDGSKTQTRRIVKPQPTQTFHTPWLTEVEGGKLSFKSTTSVHDEWRCCPYGLPGDRLWVRETFCIGRATNFTYPRSTRPEAVGPLGDKWIPSIYMPRRRSQITLEITKVRVERLQDISEADAKAEGVTPVRVGFLDPRFGGALSKRSYVEGYGELWDFINGEGAWDKNPWVWCIEFHKI